MYALTITDALPPSGRPVFAISAGPGLPGETNRRVQSAGAEHDATLLPAALEEVAARRAAIEWLLEADLLAACLV
ncbi:MAG: hypothetical protein JO184_05570 [Gammaproteobacteria bacterium]|nr:hypothetical protein [Gammaproteobacteria bacterium]MBV8306454.1 hypothetical protein [Gammaproteobacteria bacterium]MBV8402887.1 hypothetical protein [Gammaproteobacteria bacterium]